MASDVKRGLNLTRVGTLIQQCELQFRLITAYAILSYFFVMFNADTIWKLFFSTTWYFFFTTNNIIVKFISFTTTFWIRFHKFFDKLKRFSFLIYYELHYCWAHIYYRHPGWQATIEAPLRKIRRSYNVPNLQKKNNRGCPSESFSKNVFQPYRPRQMYT